MSHPVSPSPPPFPSSSSASVIAPPHVIGIIPPHVPSQVDGDTSPLLRHDDPSPDAGSSDASDETPLVRGTIRGGLARYLKMVIPDIVRRKEIESADSEIVVSSNISSNPYDSRETPIETNVECDRGRAPSGMPVEIQEDQTERNRMSEHAAGSSIVPNQSVVTIKPSFAECRICQEEDDIANLESPCACSGSLKYAHRKCVQHWCNEKGDTLCEICQKPFEGGYVSPQPTEADSMTVNIGPGWEIASGQPRLFALAADQHFLDADYDDYAGSHAQSAACFRSFALMLLAFLLLRHIVSMTGTDDEDALTFFMLSLARAAGFLIPCYIMARAMNALQIRRQQQEAAIAAAAAAAEVRYLIHAGQVQGVVAPGTAAV